MDNRTARRTAEKAARDLVATRAAVVGDLGVASAERTDQAAAVTAAQQYGQKLLRAAQEQSEQLVAAAQQNAEDATARYADAHQRALAAGWTSSDLDDLGFALRTATARRRRTPTDTPGPTTAGPAGSSHSATGLAEGDSRVA